jgi:hypothetical protein
MAEVLMLYVIGPMARRDVRPFQSSPCRTLATRVVASIAIYDPLGDDAYGSTYPPIASTIVGT